LITVYSDARLCDFHPLTLFPPLSFPKISPRRGVPGGKSPQTALGTKDWRLFPSRPDFRVFVLPLNRKADCTYFPRIPPVGLWPLSFVTCTGEPDYSVPSCIPAPPSSPSSYRFFAIFFQRGHEDFWSALRSFTDLRPFFVPKGLGSDAPGHHTEGMRPPSFRR